MDYGYNRNGRRAIRKRKRRQANDNNYARDLYYLTETLRIVVGIIMQTALIGTGLVLVGVGLMRAIYLLG
ncbi:hypothetical protein [Bythopirellula goksoeyrii]|uniref:Uncharacterized protein n=1 Tax=Bythopirellula goksoeyrii TaxID=1400387 RepID=A0A5B9QAD0_9BACT|nr:hypothetical protein [Bythopirellula goksoeyrii]QEG35838.1 hypothetical protein Pr1d_31440 [Bythopirellula goksoeyrii]